MSLPIFSLIRRQDHMRALAALEAAPENSVFPAVVNCPLCHQNELHLFDDILTDGVWLYCTQCLGHGNIITFGSKIWKTDTAETIAKFVNFGLAKDSEAVRQMSDCVRAAEKAAAANLFWETASSQLWSHDDDITACRLRELGVQHEIKSGEGLIGVAHPEQVAEMCCGVGRRRWRPVRGRNPCVVFPYYDLPGRLSGFLLLQYDNNFKEKKTFIPLQYHSLTADAGYFLLNNLLQPTPDFFRGKQFIVEDAAWALELQCTNLAYGTRLAPVVASYAGVETKTSGKCWAAMFPATRLFQTVVVTPQAISQACNARGYVCVTPLSTSNEKAKQTDFVAKLRGIYRSAQTWQPTLETTLGSLSDMGGYAFATKLNIPHDKIQAFFNSRPGKFSPEFQSQVLAGLKYRPTAQEKIYGKTMIVARDNKWWTASGSLVCNAQPVITKITQTDTGAKTYSGYIILGDAQIDFTEDADKIERQGLLAFAARHAAHQGRLVTFDRMWNKRSALLAMQLHPPSVVTVSTHLGWDAAANVFRFGNYSLTNAGNVEYDHAVAQKINFPEPGIAPPETLLAFLTPSDHNSFTWAVVATIFANLLAPVLRKPWRATAIVGPAFETAKKIGTALGCDYAQTDAVHKTGARHFLRSCTAQNNFPVFIASTFDDHLFGASANKYYDANIIARTAETTAAVGVSYGWQLISGSAAPLPSALVSGFCALLPMYVQHSLRSRMSLGVAQTDFVHTIIDDLSAWLAKLYGQTFNPRHVKSKIVLPQQAHESLFREINTAILAGKLAVIPRPRRQDQPSNYLLRRKHTWWINRKAVATALAADKNIAPNWPWIIDLLIETGVFVEDELVHKLPGFVVDGKWCDQFLATGADTAQTKFG